MNNIEHISFKQKLGFLHPFKNNHNIFLILDLNKLIFTYIKLIQKNIFAYIHFIAYLNICLFIYLYNKFNLVVIVLGFYFEQYPPIQNLYPPPHNNVVIV